MTERHTLKSASGYVSKNGCEWKFEPMLAPTRDIL